MRRRRWWGYAAAGVVGSFVLGCSSGGGLPHAKYSDREGYLRQHALGRLPHADIPVVVNERVIAWMEYFQGPGRGHFERYLERSGRYRPLMEEILAAQGLPRDLVFISLIESGFNPMARSRANAVGAWQFIRGTGHRYGLAIDSWVDERRDPVKATHAAAQYFKDLYGEFGDWYLAMAAYNAGEGRVRRAVAASGSKDFWKIANQRHALLRPETRDYVPKYIAASIIAKMPERFGFGNVSYQRPLDMDTVWVETQTDLEVVATCAGVSPTEIQELNPHLIRAATPAGKKNYAIQVPPGKGRAFEVAYAQLPTEERMKVVYHRVRRGETIAAIARRYGVSSRDLAVANHVSERRRLATGVQLVVPVGRGTIAKISAEGSALDESGGRAKKIVRYRVRRGDTIGAIAAHHGVTIAELTSWNHLGKKGILRAGAQLKIYQPARGGGRKGATTALELASIAKPPVVADSQPSKTEALIHRVAPGETLGNIAQKFGVETGELMRWNRIRDPRKVRAGMVLHIRTATKVEPPQSTEPSSETLSTPVTATPVEPSPAFVETPSASLIPLQETHALPDVSYRVRPGDTLWDIARRHKVTIAEIQTWNRLSDPSAVRPGDELKILKQ